MKNTDIRYNSTNVTPTILPEMRDLLPPLTEEQNEALKADIQRNGCYSPVILNQDKVIMDGHNRQRLCTELGIPYDMVVFEFEDLLEAKQWALDTQKGRRNLEKWELGKIALKLRPEIEARAKAQQGIRSDILTPVSGSSTPVLTRKNLADSVGLGEVTMGRVMQIDDHAPTAIKEAMDRNELSIAQGYKLTKELKELPEEEREAEATRRLAALEQEKNELRAFDAEVERKGKISKIFCYAFEKAILVTPTEENVRIWLDYTRQSPNNILHSVRDAEILAETFTEIKRILEEKMLPPDYQLPVSEGKSAAEQANPDV